VLRLPSVRPGTEEPLTSNERSLDVLVVEDEHELREALSELIDEFGYKAEAAADGAEALRMLHAAPARLVLLDLSMPIMDGWEFCRRVQEDPALKNVPIAILSGAEITNSGALPQRGTDAGFLGKPVDLTRLLDILRAHCGSRADAPPPRSADEASPASGEEPPVAEGLHEVMIVEDDMDLRETLGSIVAAEGYRVTTAHNGREALSLLLGGYRPAVILVDLIMPVMDGWQLCEELATDPQLQDIPVILMSASGGPLLPPRPPRLVRLFRKPFTFVQLLDAIAKGVGTDAAGKPPA
jgi:CheY-like chemotaxis protein